MSWKTSVSAMTQVGCKPSLWFLMYLALAVALLWRSPESAGHLGSSDAIEYATSASSLVEGHGLTVFNFGEVHPTRYSPGFPVLFLAPIYAVSGSDLSVGIYAVFACGVGFAILLWLLCFRFLAPRLACCASVVSLGAALSIWQFDWVSKQLMSDIPGLFLFFVVWFAWTGREKRPEASFLLAGVATAIALSMRLTHLAFCIPFAFSLLRMRPLPLMLRRAALLLVPIVTSGALIMVYFDQTFGSPFFTGYHYWLYPSAYSLRLEGFWETLMEMPHIFLPEKSRVEPWDWIVGPLTLLLPLLAAFACRSERPEVWNSSKGAAIALGQIALPIILFYAFYPFTTVRFLLFLYIGWLTLGAVWFLSLFDRVPKFGILGLCGGTVLIILSSIPLGATLEPDYKHTLMVEADAKLPQDAVLVGEFSMMAAQHFFVRDTERRFFPLQSKWIGRGVGRAGEPKRPLVFCDLVTCPDTIDQAFEDGKRVFVIAQLTRWLTDAVMLDALLAKYPSEVTFKIMDMDAIIELFPE